MQTDIDHAFSKISIYQVENSLYASDSTGQLCLKVVRHPDGLNFHIITCLRMFVPEDIIHTGNEKNKTCALQYGETKNLKRFNVIFVFLKPFPTKSSRHFIIYSDWAQQKTLSILLRFRKSQRKKMQFCYSLTLKMYRGE